MDFDDFLVLPLFVVLAMSGVCLIGDIVRGVWSCFSDSVVAPSYPEPAPRATEVSCQGCGAPLDWHQHECPYCRRGRAQGEVAL